MAFKSCLKLGSTPPTPGCSRQRPEAGRKCVVFCDHLESVFGVADEWDRTPAEPAQKLSYQDILELKEIQRSLPRAQQKFDPLSKRPHSEYLRRVPIALLPLLPDGACTSPTGAPPTAFERNPPPSTPSPSWAKPWQPTPYVPPPETETQPAPAPGQPRFKAHNLRTPPPPIPRRKSNFTFLPLLDTPPPSLESSAASSTSHSPMNPSSRAPSPVDDAESEPEAQPEMTAPNTSQAPLEYFPLLQFKAKPVPPPASSSPSYFPPFGGQYHQRIQALSNDSLMPPSPLCLSPAPASTPATQNPETPRASPPPPPAQPSVMYINGEEVLLSPCTPKASRSVMWINGEEVVIDDGIATDDDYVSDSTAAGGYSSTGTSYASSSYSANSSPPSSPPPSVRATLDFESDMDEDGCVVARARTPLPPLKAQPPEEFKLFEVTFKRRVV